MNFLPYFAVRYVQQVEKIPKKLEILPCYFLKRQKLLNLRIQLARWSHLKAGQTIQRQTMR